MATALPLSSTTVATQTARQTKSMAGYGLLLCETSLPARNFPTITTCTTETTMHPAAAAPRTVAAASIRRKNSPNAPRELLPRPDYQRLTDLHSSHERGATARASGKQVSENSRGKNRTELCFWVAQGLRPCGKLLLWSHGWPKATPFRISTSRFFSSLFSRAPPHGR